MGSRETCPCPDGDACPDARRYGKIHPAPATPPTPAASAWGVLVSCDAKTEIEARRAAAFTQSVLGRSAQAWALHPDPTEPTAASAVTRAEYDALVKERDQARRQRDGMNEQYEAAMDVIHRNAGARRDGLCGILAWIDEAKAATARAERAEALLREARDSVERDYLDCDEGLIEEERLRRLARIDAVLDTPTDDTRGDGRDEGGTR